MPLQDNTQINVNKKIPVLIVLDSSSQDQQNVMNTDEQKQCEKQLQSQKINDSYEIRQSINIKRRRINRSLLMKKMKQKKQLKRIKSFRNKKQVAKLYISQNIENEIVQDNLIDNFKVVNDPLEKKYQQTKICVKDRLRKKFIIQKIYCKKNQQILNNKDPYVDIQFDYPFLHNQKINDESQKLFKDRLKTILSTSKQDKLFN